MQNENIDYEKKKIDLNNLTSENIMSDLFSHCVSIYTHNYNVKLTKDPDKIEEWKNKLNIDMGDEALEIQEKMLDLSIDIIEEMSNLAIKKMNQNNILNLFEVYNENKEKKLCEIITSLKNNEKISTEQSIFFLKNITKYLKKNKKIEEIEEILKIFNTQEALKIDENHLSIIFNKKIKNYESILVKIKKIQMVLILYLICLYAKKNNLNLNRNKELTKQGMIENILYNNFTNTIPKIVITTLMDHAKLINGIFASKPLEKVETNNSLLLKIGDNLSNNTEKKIDSEDIIKLLFLTINDIEPEKSLFTAKDLSLLSSIFLSSSLLVNNLLLVTNPIRN
jgi:hypothetical protein